MTQRTKNQRKSQRNIKAIDPSKQVEVAYRKELDAILQFMEDIVLDELRDDKLNDAPTEYLKWLTQKSKNIRERLDAIDLVSLSENIATKFVRGLETMNRRRFDKNASKLFGIDLERSLASSGQEVIDELAIAREYNASLIKSVSDEFKDRVNSTIMANIQSGERSTNLITQIRDEFKVTESRAKLIARDQTSKTNASLVKVRSEALGSKTYIWSGSMDERERDSHRVLEGKLCKMDDPKVYSDDGGKTWKSRRSIGATENHPAVDVNCRCAMLPQVQF